MNTNLIPQLTAPGGGSPLRVATIVKQNGEEILEGTVVSPEHGIFHIQHGILDLLPMGVGILSSAQSTNLAYPVARFYEKPWRVNSLTLLSGQPLHVARERQILSELLGTPQGPLWLDLAASSGLYSRWLAPKLANQNGSVICLDFSNVMLRQAQAAAQSEHHTNIAFVAARGEHLPFADGTLDGVVCGGSLNEFGASGVNAVLRDVYRALKPGGVGIFMHLFTATQRLGKTLQALFARPSGIAFWTRPETNALFTQSGFRVEQHKDFGMVGFTRIVKEG